MKCSFGNSTSKTLASGSNEAAALKAIIKKHVTVVEKFLRGLDQSNATAGQKITITAYANVWAGKIKTIAVEYGQLNNITVPGEETF